MNEAFLTNAAVADPERLTRENQQAIMRLGYDPATEQRKPGPEEMQKAAQAIFARIRPKPPQS